MKPFIQINPEHNKKFLAAKNPLQYLADLVECPAYALAYQGFFLFVSEKVMYPQITFFGRTTSYALTNFRSENEKATRLETW